MAKSTAGASVFALPAAEAPEDLPHLLLVGNPNVGKSVLFGCLTGRYVTVSNYPGTTIEVTRGTATINGQPFQVLDTPGTNQLTPQSEDERVTRDILLETTGARVLQVADTKNLQRALVLTLTLAEMDQPVTLALNMRDEARSRGIDVRADRLEEILGIPVVDMIATQRIGLPQLEAAIPNSRRPKVTVAYPDSVETRVGAMLPHLRATGGQARFFALQLLSGDSSLASILQPRLAPADHGALVRLAREAAESEEGNLAQQIQLARLTAADRVMNRVYTRPDEARSGFASRISRWALHPLKGIFMLAALLYLTFWFVGLFGAGTLVGLMEEGLFGQVLNPLAVRATDAVLPFPHEHEMHTIHQALEIPLTPTRGIPLGVQWEKAVPSSDYEIPGGAVLSNRERTLRFTHDLLVGPYGLLTMGLSYGFAIVLPIVATFFLLFSFMEDSGYLPRLAVMVNNLFKTMGLNGKAVLPMVLGLGCDTMATMTTRVLETRKQRLIVTLLLALGVPCSAQLGVLLAMLSHVTWLGSLVWGVVVFGVMLLVGLLASKLFPGPGSDFLLELPPIRRPVLSNIAVKTVARIEWYLKEVLPLFLIGTALLFVLDRTHALTAIRVAAAPVVVHWLGLPLETADAFVVGFLRRDYGAVFLLQAATGPQAILNGTQILVSMIVITLFIPCIANVFIIVKEHGWKVALGMMAFIFPFAFLIGGLVRLGAQALGISF